MKSIRKCLFVVIAVVVLSIAGCKKDRNAPAELVVMCGSSFVPPNEQLCSEFTAETGIKVITTSAGSEDFLPLVKTAQKGDILITHDPYLDYVSDAGALGDHVHVGFVAPVVAVQKGNPKNIRSIEDMTGEGIRVALSDPKYSTCGEMVFALMEKKGIKEAMMKNVGVRLTKGHGTLGTLLKTHAVDAVIMWNGVANTFGDSLEIVPTPYEYDKEIHVHIMGLSYSKRPEEVRQFIEFAHRRGKAIFGQYGYVK